MSLLPPQPPKGERFTPLEHTPLCGCLAAQIWAFECIYGVRFPSPLSELGLWFTLPPFNVFYDWFGYRLWMVKVFKACKADGPRSYSIFGYFISKSVSD